MVVVKLLTAVFGFWGRGWDALGLVLDRGWEIRGRGCCTCELLVWTRTREVACGSDRGRHRGFSNSPKGCFGGLGGWAVLVLLVAPT